jgi:hypothetical protein
MSNNYELSENMDTTAVETQMVTLIEGVCNKLVRKDMGLTV